MVEWIAALTILVPESAKQRFWEAVSDVVVGRPPDARNTRANAIAILEEEAAAAERCGKKRRARCLRRVIRRMKDEVDVE